MQRDCNRQDRKGEPVEIPGFHHSFLALFWTKKQSRESLCEYSSLVRVFSLASSMLFASKMVMSTFRTLRLFPPIAKIRPLGFTAKSRSRTHSHTRVSARVGRENRREKPRLARSAININLRRYIFNRTDICCFSSRAFVGLHPVAAIHRTSAAKLINEIAGNFTRQIR